MLSWLSRRGNSIDIFRSPQALRREFKRPGDHERNRKTYYYYQDHEADGPVWDFEKWKDLRRDLNQQPTDNGVGDRNLVNVSPL